ncbi:hypothetical protein GWI33_007007 [Rhynchophorus ferrugineus]|uniref:Uncharacterized protein n=1 Tax=Rhynchophorus ferrugineus TaxID=354439 RepID=A0A834MDC3_RHYFE|nr:hypothetical protein GWI33_007007 [Rhynchophorus ferrugineus]
MAPLPRRLCSDRAAVPSSISVAFTCVGGSRQDVPQIALSLLDIVATQRGGKQWCRSTPKYPTMIRSIIHKYCKNHTIKMFGSPKAKPKAFSSEHLKHITKSRKT